MHVNHNMEVVRTIRGITDISEGQGEAASFGIIPARLIKLRAVPGDFRNAKAVDTPGEIVTFEMLAIKPALLQQHRPEANHILVPIDVVPIEPVQGTVMAIGVVVAVLSAAMLIASNKHGYTLGQVKEYGSILDLLGSELVDPDVVRLPFSSTIPAQILINAITATLSIRPVVLGVVGNKVIEGETIMGIDEVDTIHRLMMAPLVEISTAGDSTGHLSNQPGITLQETAESIPILPIPFSPTGPREVTDLVEAGGIPCLGNGLAVSENLIQLNAPNHRRVGEGNAILTTRKHRAFIESESIDMHIVDPEPQTIKNELLAYGVVTIKGIATTRVVIIKFPTAIRAGQIVVS